MKTSELIGAALDWAVAKADGNLYPVGDVRLIDGRLLTITPGDHETQDLWREFSPSSDWAQGGPIIEREQIWIRTTDEGEDDPDCKWRAEQPYIAVEIGPTPLIAAMRCFVASKLGDEVGVPKELG